MKQRLAQWARQIKRELQVLALATRHPDTPWYAQAVAVAVLAYAFSPLDLIPDPIPVLGYLDDLVLLPLGVLLARRLIPAAVIRECTERAAQGGDDNPRSVAGAVFVIAVWLALAAWCVALVRG